MRPNVFKACKAKLEMSVHNAHLAKPNNISTQTLHTSYYRHSGEGACLAATGPAHLADNINSSVYHYSRVKYLGGLLFDSPNRANATG